jgi:hypothetical protein
VEIGQFVDGRNSAWHWQLLCGLDAAKVDALPRARAYGSEEGIISFRLPTT